MRPVGLSIPLAAAALLVACKTTVELPPRVVLDDYHRIGMVELAGRGVHDVGRMTSRELVGAIQDAQPGVRIVEIGPAPGPLDLEAIQALGEKYRVDAVLVGELELGEAKPQVHLSKSLLQMKARAQVDGVLSARLVETEGGATVWTDTARGSADLAHLSASTAGLGGFGARDPEQAYAQLVSGLVVRVTRDFRPRFERR